MMETVYLVGQISPKIEETYNWRIKIQDTFKGQPGIQFINPCNNAFNQNVLTNKEYAITDKTRTSGIDVLPAKDYTYCRRSSVALVNMNHYDTNRPMIGSFFELAWYFSMPEKTVIAFADDLNSYEVKHPFVQQAVTTWCDNVEDAADILKNYFLTVE